MFLNSLIFGLAWSLIAHTLEFVNRLKFRQDDESINAVMRSCGWYFIILIAVYLSAIIFPLVLFGYHSYLYFGANGVTTNEHCKGISTKKYKSAKWR
jgi:hypothetical protein